MGNKYCNVNGKEEEISQRGYTKIIKLSKYRGGRNKYDKGLH